jgi:heat shock protein HtpX
MEMCVDNPRSGFADIFATHPSIDSRVTALVEHAGGHDTGPIDLPEPDQAPEQIEADSESDRQPANASAKGPWSEESAAPTGDKPFLPDKPPVALGESAAQSPSGPWSPARKS